MSKRCSWCGHGDRLDRGDVLPWDEMREQAVPIMDAYEDGRRPEDAVGWNLEGYSGFHFGCFYRAIDAAMDRKRLSKR